MKVVRPPTSFSFYTVVTVTITLSLLIQNFKKMKKMSSNATEWKNRDYFSMFLIMQDSAIFYCSSICCWL